MSSKLSSMSALSVHLAYDGSMNGDWIARYAFHLALGSVPRRITVHCVLDGGLNEAGFAPRVAALKTEAGLLGLEVAVRQHACLGTVAATLCAVLPKGSEQLVVCGVRARESGKGMLAGTVSEKLLQAGLFRVLAVRVVHPGVLGAPQDVLFAVSGNPATVYRGLPVLGQLGGQIKNLHLLRVMEQNTLALRRLSLKRHEALMTQGRGFLGEVQATLLRELPHAPAMDHTVVVSDDWPREVVIEAGKVKARLILMGGTERSFPVRFLFGDPYEQVLHRAPCDVAIFGGLP